MEQNKAVVIGVNYYTGLSTVRALGRNGVYVVACEYDKNAYGLKSKYVNEVLWIDDVKSNSESAFRTLIDYGKKQKSKPVLIPTHDNYVLLCDKYLDELKKYYLIPIQKQGLMTEVMHKNTLANLAKKHNVLIPEYYVLNENPDFDFIKNKIGYPCIIKPNNSNNFVRKFKRKVLICNNEEELIKSIKIMNESDLSGKVEQIIKGFDDHMFTYDAYVSKQGKVTHDVTMQKLRQFPINFGASVYIHQTDVPKIREIGKNFLENINWRGFAEIEFKKMQDTDDYYLIEINTRMTNFNALLEALGLNMAYLTYLEMTGNELGEKHIVEDTDLAFRYFFEDLAAIRDYKKTGQLTNFDVIKTLNKKKVGAVWAKDDPMPAIKYFINKIKNHF